MQNNGVRRTGGQIDRNCALIKRDEESLRESVSKESSRNSFCLLPPRGNVSDRDRSIKRH